MVFWSGGGYARVNRVGLHVLTWYPSLYVPGGHVLTSYYETAKVVFQEEQWRYSNRWQMR